VPTAVSIQGGDGHWVGTCCRTHAEAMRTVVDRTGAVLIGSPSFRDEVVGNLGCDPGRFTIVPGATDPRRFTPAERPPGALREPPVLLFHGRVDRRKGVLDLLEALPDGVRLVVSGIGPDLDEARARADGRTTFLGYVPIDEAPEVYRSADVFVSPTYSEGFSNTLLEAMASGLPVVTTDSVGVVDAVRDGENGLLHRPGDVGALAAALRRVLDDGALRARLATTALEEVRRLYSWPVLARTIADVHERLAGTDPDLDWSPPAEVDLSCRFRAAPHLL
jgi:glycosyltransferase involved in cell wall biosynthesis